MSERRIGVYICHCGGNISDYVDVAAVRDAVKDLPDVVHAETSLFACSDGTQQDMIKMIRDQNLDGLVVASCSPKLHLFTFRGVSRRAGLNPFEYTQANIREQCSWAHTDDRAGATTKAIGLVKGAIAKTRESSALEPMAVQTTPASLVVGAGIAGLRAAIGLADLGLRVYLLEQSATVGGWVGQFGPTFPNDRDGREMVADLLEQIQERPTITLLTNAELTAKSGSFGNYAVTITVHGESESTVEATVGSIVIATGFDTYQPEIGEYGYGIDGVVTLAQFKELVEASPDGIKFHDRPVRTVTYVYCVGNRQPGGNEYCSKYCCSATVHASLEVSAVDPAIHQYHLYRDIRTYGKYELLYEQSRKRGSVFMKFPDETPPTVERAGDGRLLVTTRDTLSGGVDVTIPSDLVVLVTGMVPRENTELTKMLHLPVGGDGFFNEIHPKLRPVETVVDGVMIAGTCQGPKTISESVASGLAAVAQSGAMLMKGVAELDPLVAVVDASACTWCGECQRVCPYEAITQVAVDGHDVASIDAAVCKGCGGCTSYCPSNAIDLLGATDAQMQALIENLVEVTVP
ncbi:MAG: CoB--CoM heterodisulfide reductase iron-sulfur subunit A family protein [Actinomycetales bacterium]|nr:CoB--CoM heterodisulfide reductase iron-sulfur subunit A family protein [Actinomycetales bacterium]